MKTLIFVIGLMMGCRPTPVEINDIDAGGSGVDIDAHTGIVGEPELPPNGIIAADDCRHIDIGDTPCNFRLYDQNQDVWELYDFKDDIIVLDFSAGWCGPCQTAGLYTQQLQDDYAAEGVQIVTILIDGLTPTVAPTEADIDIWVGNHGITTAAILQGSRDKMIDMTGVAGYSIGAWPTYIYIGRDMKFFAGHTGFSEEYMRSLIEGAI